VVEHDRIDPDAVDPSRYTGIVLSPGPGRPENAVNAGRVLLRFHGRMPILGVCLGHQVVATAFGARVVRAARPMHGMLSDIHHSGQGLFAGLPDPLAVTRYHSLIVDRASLPDTLAVTAWTDDGLVMGLRHREYDIESVQFHPEAHLTQSGLELLANFTSRCSLPGHAEGGAR
jgi:anthranilate synthase/aminodeoxychorismate synthase-like glutamine amidotransferase